MAGTSTEGQRSAPWWLGAVLVLGAAACGGGSGSTDDAGTDAAQEEAAPDEADGTGDDSTDGSDPGAGEEDVSVEDAMAAYSTCMDSQGVDPATTAAAPSPEELVEMGAAGADVLPPDDAFAAAHEECWPALEAAVLGGTAPADEPPPEDDELAQQIAGIVTCMNDRGYNFAETTAAEPYVLSPVEGEDFDWDDPAVVRDRTDCEAAVGLSTGG